jgi:hypothetical protein
VIHVVFLRPRAKENNAITQFDKARINRLNPRLPKKE